MSKNHKLTITYPHGWSAKAQMSIDVVTDRHAVGDVCGPDRIRSRRLDSNTILVVDQEERSYTLAEIASLLGLCGELKECHLLTSALRQYACIREALRLGDSSTDHEWQAYGSRELDRASPKDYEMLCATVGIVFGASAEADQREALVGVLA